jgi:Raf kinase inhibitor-like YbhB/YbcL family protein
MKHAASLGGALVAAALAMSSLPLVAAAGGFKVTSTDVQSGKTIGDMYVFSDFGCTGKNVSPALSWSGAPAGTKSFAVTVYDPDAPTGSGWWHWVVYNLPAATTSLPQGAGDGKAPKLPAGAVQGRTDFGSSGYGGPCPPQGDKPHHYTFTVFALKVDKLDLPADATAAFVGYNLNGNSLGKASLTALFGRPKAK